MTKYMIPALVMATALIFTALTARADEYVFVLPIPTGAALASDDDPEKMEDQASDILSRICGILSEKTGDDIECAVIRKSTHSMLTKENTDRFVKQIEEMNYSGLYISSNDYYRLIQSGYDMLVPAISMTFFKKDYDQVCFYFKEDSGVDELDDLRGRNWAGSYFYMPTRYILFKNGIDETPGEFFSEARHDPDDSWSKMAGKLIEGDVSVFTGTTEEESLGRVKDKSFSVIKRGFCETHRSTHIIAFRKSMPREKMTELRQILLGAHKDKAFQQYWFIFSAIQGHFIPFSEEAFKYTKDYVDTANDRGWNLEQIKFVYGEEKLESE